MTKRKKIPNLKYITKQQMGVEDKGYTPIQNMAMELLLGESRELFGFYTLLVRWARLGNWEFGYTGVMTFCRPFGWNLGKKKISEHVNKLIELGFLEKKKLNGNRYSYKVYEVPKYYGGISAEEENTNDKPIDINF